ncbi:MAG: histone deacetylase [Desulfitobacteriaceae bacterium]|nr:histone deacetylase [Desulfitobacteriaceae bacterium]MDD4752052.1 histone deacetylase [Desulfitobacteriaceae bacterium]
MQKPTGLVFFPAFDWSISPTHPERQERLLYTRDQLFEEGIMDLPQIKEYRAQTTGLEHIYRTHICVPDVSAQITDAHLIAVGSMLRVADAFFQGEVRNGFVMVRPPGHHAMWVSHGNRGFCNINNEAILVDYLRCKYGVKKVAIVDTDVHHGDGTQDIFWHDPDVLCISFHQDGRTLFPGTGFLHDLGGPNAYAKTINIPLLPGTTDREVLMVLDNLILPILEDFQPDIVINSAGQDNHYTDPLASLNMTAGGYALLNEKLSPNLAVLEGGYAVETALPYVNTAITLAMAGLDYSFVREPNLPVFRKDPELFNYTKDIISQLLQIWKGRKKADLIHIFGREKVYTRSKNIYYDTDGFREQQEESIYRCTDCSGYVKVVSHALQGDFLHHVFAIRTPFHACPRCRKLAAEDFNRAVDEGKFTQYCWQDQAGRKFHLVDKNGVRVIDIGVKNERD